MSLSTGFQSDFPPAKDFKFKVFDRDCQATVGVFSITRQSTSIVFTIKVKLQLCSLYQYLKVPLVSPI